MKNLKKIFMLAGILAVIVGAAVGGYYIYESIYFISTENAQLAANIVTITPEVTGKVTVWAVKEGDMVKKDQLLGRQDISALVTSSAINSQALSGGADSIAAKAEIRSPIEGKVLESSVVIGQVISPGLAVARVADTANIFIKAYIKETQIFEIAAGQKVDITIDAYGNQAFSGYVMSVGQATQSAFSSYPTLNTSGEYTKETQLIPIKIGIVNEEGLDLMPGMNAVIKIHIK